MNTRLALKKKIKISSRKKGAAMKEYKWVFSGLESQWLLLRTLTAAASMTCHLCPQVKKKHFRKACRSRSCQADDLQESQDTVPWPLRSPLPFPQLRNRQPLRLSWLWELQSTFTTIFSFYSPKIFWARTVSCHLKLIIFEKAIRSSGSKFKRYKQAVSKNEYKIM